MRFAAVCFAAALLGTVPAMADNTPGAGGAVSTAAALPPLGKPWLPADYTAAAAAIVSRSDADLPRLSDTKSAPIIEKIADIGALDVCVLHSREQAVVAQMVTACNTILYATLDILKRYYKSDDPSVADSAMRIVEFLVHLAVREGAVVAQLALNLDPEAPDYATRLSGTEMVKAGLLQMFSGAGQMLAQRDVYSESERLCLATVVAQVFPALEKEVTPQAYAALSAQFRNVGNTDTNVSIKALLSNIGAAPI
jgi:hypothetical protein